MAFDFTDTIARAEIVPGRVALIDGDIIAYQAAFRADGQGLPAGYRACKDKLAEYMAGAKAESCAIYLTGKGNYRYGIAKVQGYKAHRKDEDRPDSLPDMRDYLVKHHGAFICDGQEADDAMGIAQAKAEWDFTCICSVDKDLRMIPGWHYDPMTGEIDFVEDPGSIDIGGKSAKKIVGGGLKFFYAQLLVGDTADNIPGCPCAEEATRKLYKIRKSKGLGPVAAFKILETADTEQEMFNRVLDAYKDHYGTGYFELNDEQRTAYGVMLEMGRLLWIRRHPEELWTPDPVIVKGYQTHDAAKND